MHFRTNLISALARSVRAGVPWIEKPFCVICRLQIVHSLATHRRDSCSGAVRYLRPLVLVYSGADSMQKGFNFHRPKCYL